MSIFLDFHRTTGECQRQHINSQLTNGRKKIYQLLKWQNRRQLEEIGRKIIEIAHWMIASINSPSKHLECLPFTRSTSLWFVSHAHTHTMGSSACLSYRNQVIFHGFDVELLSFPICMLVPTNRRHRFRQVTRHFQHRLVPVFALTWKMVNGNALASNISTTHWWNEYPNRYLPKTSRRNLSTSLSKTPKSSRKLLHSKDNDDGNKMTLQTN